MTELAFWISLGVVAYTFLGYPVALLTLSGLKQTWDDLRFAAGRRNRRQRVLDSPPSVSILFSAYNEEAILPAKIRNCADLRYPEDRLEILAGCDGCTDGTLAVARNARLPGFRAVDFPERSGKPETLNRLVPHSSGDILVFCDANTMLDPDAVTLLVRHFADPRVGCVCGELRLVSGETGQRAEGVYWRYEVFLKFLESRLNLLVGANGGLFAIRRELFAPLPKKGIIDDFLQAMQIRMRGYRVVYDPEAVAYETSAHSIQEEFRRRVRIGAGNIHALRFTWRLLSPTAGLVAFSYWSHKVLRWISPFALLATLALAIVLSAQPLYAAFAAAGILIAALALLGYSLELRHVRRSAYSIPYYFVSMNLALLLGFVRFLSGQQTVVWRPTPRR